MVINGYQIYCGNHIVRYRNVGSLCCIPESNETSSSTIFQMKKMSDTKLVLSRDDKWPLGIDKSSPIGYTLRKPNNGGGGIPVF